MRRNRSFHDFSKIFLGAAALAALASCGERAGTGTNQPIPNVIVNCTSSSCKQNISNATVTVLITQFDCDPNNFQFGAVSSSFKVNCTISGGCFGTTSSWITIQNQQATTISDGVYSICGRIDFQNTPFIYTDDAAGTAFNVPIQSSGTAPVTLSTWVGP